MISGRTNVGDVQSRRLLASLDLASGKSAWADASAFAGAERKAKPADPEVPRVLDWTLPDSSDDGTHAVVAARSQDNKDRWYADGRSGDRQGEHPRSPARRRVDSRGLDSADRRRRRIWRRRAARASRGSPTTSASLFLSEKDGWMHVYSIDVTAASPAGQAADVRQVGGDERAALRRPKDVVPHDERSAPGRAALLHDVGRRRPADEADDDDRIERGDGVARREVARRSSTRTRSSRPSCT